MGMKPRIDSFPAPSVKGTVSSTKSVSEFANIPGTVSTLKVTPDKKIPGTVSPDVKK